MSRTETWTINLNLPLLYFFSQWNIPPAIWYISKKYGHFISFLFHTPHIYILLPLILPQPVPSSPFLLPLVQGGLSHFFPEAIIVLAPSSLGIFQLHPTQQQEWSGWSINVVILLCHLEILQRTPCFNSKVFLLSTAYKVSRPWPLPFLLFQLQLPRLLPGP